MNLIYLQIAQIRFVHAKHIIKIIKIVLGHLRLSSQNLAVCYIPTFCCLLPF